MAAAQQLGLSLVKDFSGKHGQALLGIDPKTSRAIFAPNTVSLCHVCQSIRFWDGRYKKHLSRSRDLPSSALGCSLCVMLNAKVREVYGRLGFELADYPARLSIDPIRATAVTREAMGEGLKEELLPYLFFNIEWVGADTAIKVDCPLYASPGMSPSKCVHPPETLNFYRNPSRDSVQNADKEGNYKHWLPRCSSSCYRMAREMYPLPRGLQADGVRGNNCGRYGARAAQKGH